MVKSVPTPSSAQGSLQTLDVRAALTKNVVTRLLGGEHDGSQFTVLLIVIETTTEDGARSDDIPGDLTFADDESIGHANVTGDIKKMLKPFGGDLEPWTVIDVLEYRAEMYPGTKLFRENEPVTFTKIRKTFIDPEFKKTMKLIPKFELIKMERKFYFDEKYIESFSNYKSCICPRDETCLLKTIFGHLRFNFSENISVEDDVRIQGQKISKIENIPVTNKRRTNIDSDQPLVVEWTETLAALIAKQLVDARFKHNCNPLELRHVWEMGTDRGDATFLRVVVEKTRDENLLRLLHPVIEKEMNTSVRTNLRCYAMERMGCHRDLEMVKYLKTLNVPLMSSPQDANDFFGIMQEIDDPRFIEIFEAEGFDVNPNDVRFDLLHSMALMHFRDCVEYLLNRGFDIDLRDKEDYTSFMRIILFSDFYNWDRMEFLMWMISKGADPLAITRDERTCLHLAIAKGQEIPLLYLTQLGFVAVRRGKGNKDEQVDVFKRMREKRQRNLLTVEKVYFWPNKCEKCENRCPSDQLRCLWCGGRRGRKKAKGPIQEVEKSQVSKSVLSLEANADFESQILTENSNNAIIATCVNDLLNMVDELNATHDPVCCEFESCSKDDLTISTNDEHYFEAICLENCRVSFHRSCWSEFKGDESTKNFVGADCMTSKCPSKIESVKKISVEGNLICQYTREEREKKAKQRRCHETDNLISHSKEKDTTEDRDDHEGDLETASIQLSANEKPNETITTVPNQSPDLIHVDEKFLKKLEKSVEEEIVKTKSSKKKKKKKNKRVPLFEFNTNDDNATDTAVNVNQSDSIMQSSSLNVEGESEELMKEQSQEIAYRSLVEHLTKTDYSCSLANLRETIDQWDTTLRQSLLTPDFRANLILDPDQRFAIRHEGVEEMVILKANDTAAKVKAVDFPREPILERIQSQVNWSIELTKVKEEVFRSMQESKDESCGRCATLETRCATLESRCATLENRCATMEERFNDLSKRLRTSREVDERSEAPLA